MDSLSWPSFGEGLHLAKLFGLSLKTWSGGQEFLPSCNGSMLTSLSKNATPCENNKEMGKIFTGLVPIRFANKHYQFQPN